MSSASRKASKFEFETSIPKFLAFETPLLIEL